MARNHAPGQLQRFAPGRLGAGLDVFEHVFQRVGEPRGIVVAGQRLQQRQVRGQVARGSGQAVARAIDRVAFGGGHGRRFLPLVRLDAHHRRGLGVGFAPSAPQRQTDCCNQDHKDDQPGQRQHQRAGPPGPVGATDLGHDRLFGDRLLGDRFLRDRLFIDRIGRVGQRLVHRRCSDVSGRFELGQVAVELSCDLFAQRRICILGCRQPRGAQRLFQPGQFRITDADPVRVLFDQSFEIGQSRPELFGFETGREQFFLGARQLLAEPIDLGTVFLQPATGRFLGGRHEFEPRLGLGLTRRGRRIGRRRRIRRRRPVD